MSIDTIVFFVMEITTVLIIDCYFSLSGKYTKLKKMKVHLLLWPIAIPPMGLIFFCIATVHELEFVALTILICSVLLTIGCYVSFFVLNHHFNKKFQNNDLHFIMEANIKLMELIKKRLPDIERTNSPYEKLEIMDLAERVNKQAENTEVLLRSYLNACENFDLEKLQQLTEQITLEKKRLNSYGIVYDENGKITNIERMLDFI